MSARKFAKDAGLMSITQAILGLQAFLLLPILTKFLGATNFGIWSQISITVSLLGGFAMLGLGQAVLRFISGQENKEKVSKEFISVIFISIVTAIVFGILIFIFSDKLGLLLTHVTGSGFFFKFVILLLSLSVIHRLFANFFMAKENVKLYSSIEIARAALELGLIYIFLSKGYGLLGLIGTFILVKLTIIFLGLLNGRKYLKLARPSLKVIKPYLSFSLPLTILPILTWTIQSGDQYIIGFYFGAKAVGIYGLAYSLCFMIRTLLNPITLILTPALSRAWNKGNWKEVRTYFKYSYKYLFMIAIPAAFGLSMLSEPIIKLISTTEFIGGSILIPFISAGFVLYPFWTLGARFLFLKKETKKFTKVMLFLVIINILLNILLVPFLGPLGAAISTLITFGISAAIGIRLLKDMGFGLMGKFLFKCVFSSVLMSVAILILRNILVMNEIIKLGIIVVISVAVYFLILFYLKGISKSELRFFRTLVFSGT